MLTRNESIPGWTYYVLAVGRIGLGLIFLWAFIDKLFGLGISTCLNAKTGAVTVMCSQSWLQGGSPTAGFLDHAPKGPFADVYHSMAGQAWADWLFMGGLLFLGVALIFGVGMRLAAIGGTLLLLMLWAAVLPPASHPFLDEHIIYIFFLWTLLGTNNQQRLGLGKWWQQLAIVKRFSILC